MDQGVKVKFQIEGFPFTDIYFFFLMVIAPRVTINHDAKETIRD